MRASDHDAAGVPAAIPNFAWVDGRWLARGQQPPLTSAAYADLQACGFSAVLSLRAEREYPDGGWRSYVAADERALCQATGLTFHHVACTDFQAPDPGEVVKALSILHGEIEQGGAVYMHCLAGVGRTGVVSGAWQMVRGASGTEALQHYAHYCEEDWRRRVAQRPLAEHLHRIGARFQAWALLTVARELGRPARLPADLVRPERPAGWATWRRRFRAAWAHHPGLESARIGSDAEAGPAKATTTRAPASVGQRALETQR